MQEFMASSGLIIVEVAVVLIIIVSVLGYLMRRKQKGAESDAKKFVKNINANVAQRKETHIEFATETLGEHLDESEISAHVDSLLEKENSLYSKFIKVIMHHEGHAIDQIHRYVDDLVRACHIKLPESSEANDDESSQVERGIDNDSDVYSELVHSLREENEDLRHQIEKLKAENEHITAEYEIIYEKHEALTKQRSALG